jgi:acyl-CoA reductase-like NAD-dependent aldehyde dehydrogenase
LQLGGKSPNVILESVADFDKAVAQGVQWCMGNTGQVSGSRPGGMLYAGPC